MPKSRAPASLTRPRRPRTRPRNRLRVVDARSQRPNWAPGLTPPSSRCPSRGAWRADAEAYLPQIYPVIEAAGLRYTAEVVAYETDNTSVGEIVCERAAEMDAAAVIMASQEEPHTRVLHRKRHELRPAQV